MADTLIEQVADAALRRRSIRRYQPRPVEDALLRELLRLAGRAPSAWNLQPWRFVVVREPATKGELHGAAFRQRQVESAPAVIVLYSDMADALERVDEALHPGMSEEARAKTRAGILEHFGKMTPEAREAWGRGQAYIALGYLLLLAEVFGLATSPMLGFDPAGVKSLLGLPEHVEVPALVAVGYGDEPGAEPHRLEVDSILHWR